MGGNQFSYQSRWQVMLLPIPVLWCLLAGAVEWGLGVPFAWLLPAAAAASVLAATRAAAAGGAGRRARADRPGR